MAFEQKDNNGSLFKNTKREKDTHPNATGTAMIDGVEYWVSAWTKESEKAGKWQSLSFTRKDDVKHGKQKAEPQDDSDLPF